MPGKKNLLIDGHGIAFRAFFAVPMLNAPDGTPTNVLVGFFNMFARAVIKRERIPFSIESEEQALIERAKRVTEQIRAQAILNGTADMSMDEINEEIRKAREERRERMKKAEEQK